MLERWRGTVWAPALSCSAPSMTAQSSIGLAEGAAGYLDEESYRQRRNRGRPVLKCAEGATSSLPTQLAGALAGEVKVRARGNSALLTPRESEVVRMIAEGLTVPPDCKTTLLSTVKTHVQNLYDKLGVSDRGAAVAAAMRRRLLE